MTAFIIVWLVSAFLAGLILLFDKDRKAERRKNKTSFTRSYVDAVKKEYDPRRKAYYW
jgi:hypothetical protein